MKKGIKLFFVGLIMSIALVIIGFGIATSMYSSGMTLKVPKITISWVTVNHDLYLTDEVSIDSESR